VNAEIPWDDAKLNGDDNANSGQAGIIFLGGCLFDALAPPPHPRHKVLRKKRMSWPVSDTMRAD